MERPRLKKPLIYQDAPDQQTGERTTIEGEYKLASNGQIGFQVEDYDTTRRLVIDPVINYSTYLGGGYSDYGHDVSVDTSGQAVVVGITDSTDYPTTSGAYQAVKYGFSDIFISKFDQDGSGLVFSTFLGGSSSEDYARVVLDSVGNIYVTAYTLSSDFPTTAGAYRTVSPIRKQYYYRQTVVIRSDTLILHLYRACATCGSYC